MKKVLVLIPARGGSTRLPGKNLMTIGGRSLIGRAVDAARGCAGVGRILVSTDDGAIAREARSCGAEVPFLRPPELATSSAASDDVVRHALRWLAEHESYVPDVIALLQPTSPLRTAAHLSAALELMNRTGASSVISVTAARPAGWLYVAGADGTLTKLFDDVRPPPGLPDGARLMLPNGAIYLATHAFHEQNGVFLGPGTQAFVMGQAESVDVDTADDFALAEAIARGRTAELSV